MDATPQRRPQTVLYAEPDLKTNFSFLEGASHPDELVHRAAELGYAALAVTDRNSLAGVVRAHTAAKQMQLKLLVGAEITPLDASPMVLLATDLGAAYGRLVRLITLGRRNAPKGECRIRFDDLAAHAVGLIAAVGGAFDALAPGSAGGSGGESMSISLRPAGGPPGRAGGYGVECNGMSIAIPPAADRHHLHRYRELFADRCYLLAELHRGPNDERQLEQRIDSPNKPRVPLVAANDVHYHHPSAVRWPTC